MISGNSLITEFKYTMSNKFQLVPNHSLICQRSERGWEQIQIFYYVDFVIVNNDQHWFVDWKQMILLDSWTWEPRYMRTQIEIQLHANYYIKSTYPYFEIPLIYTTLDKFILVSMIKVSSSIFFRPFDIVLSVIPLLIIFLLIILI